MKSKMLAKKLLAVLAIASLVFLVGCGGNTSQPPPPSQPTAVTVSPSSVTVQTGGVQQFTATVSPSGANQAVIWSLSGTGCTGASCGTIDATGKYTAPASVPNPPTATVRATSVVNAAAAAFAAVNITNPIPAITTISPNSADTGGAAFTLTVNGSNFVTGSVVRWNDSDRPTAFISASQVSAQIPTSDIAVAGTAFITVFNPAPGGGASNSLTFTITGPTITSISPNSADTGGAAFPLTVNGRNFVASSVVNFAGVARATTFVSAAQLTAAIPAAAITTAGIAAVTVTNPAPSGGASNPVNFTIGRFLPRFAYVANAGSNDVSMYTINATTGALAPIAPGTVAAGMAPVSLAVDPSGRFVYVANLDSNNVSMYTIDATTGALTSIGTTAAGTGSGFASVAVDPSGRFAYVANGDFFFGEGNTVSMYTIDAATGALTAIAPGTIAARLTPLSVAVDPSGRFAYAANSLSDNVSMYAINATTGALTLIDTPVAAGRDPLSAAVDPSGRFAYVANEGSSPSSGNVSMYTINATTGALAPIAPGTIAAGINPRSVAIVGILQ
jgi:6-phosphogluconolactonase